MIFESIWPSPRRDENWFVSDLPDLDIKATLQLKTELSPSGKKKAYTKVNQM